jgi:hypothetical protein
VLLLLVFVPAYIVQVSQNTSASRCGFPIMSKTLLVCFIALPYSQKFRYCRISFNSYVPRHRAAGFVPNVTLVPCPKTFVRNLATKMRPNKGIEGPKSPKMGKGPPQFSRCTKP